MAYVNSNLAREISRLYRWPEKIWSRRYQGIVISDEEAAQIARLRYLLANGCKEGLVARPQDWPGVHVAKALIQGEDLTGTWFDRTQEYAARNRGEKFDRLQYATPETLYLSPLPCWKHLPKEAWRGRPQAHPGDRRGDRNAPCEYAEPTVGSRSDREQASPPSAQDAEEIPSAALPCIQFRRPPRTLGSLPSLRSRLPLSGITAPFWLVLRRRRFGTHFTYGWHFSWRWRRRGHAFDEQPKRQRYFEDQHRQPQEPCHR
jgi:hypothetical protein